jgi:hypothetical protein
MIEVSDETALDYLAQEERRIFIDAFDGHDGKFAKKIGAGIAALDRLRALRLSEQPPSCAEAVASAKAEATAVEQRERCAKIAEGEVVFEHYRRWPCWQPHGDRSKEWEGTQLADAIAAAIRKG